MEKETSSHSPTEIMQVHAILCSAFSMGNGDPPSSIYLAKALVKKFRELEERHQVAETKILLLANKLKAYGEHVIDEPTGQEGPFIKH